MNAALDRPAMTGTVFAAADSTLNGSPIYRSFRAGAASRADFNRLVESRAQALRDAGVPGSDVPFMKRFPRNPRACVGRVLADLHRRGILARATCDADSLDRTERMMARFDHGPFKTYIYPEEGLLLAAIAEIRAPRHAVFLGSYYGYWSHWAIPGIVAAGGRVTLVDPNEACCEIARRNLKANGFADAAEVVATSGEDFLARTAEMFDLVVLDAENPRDHPDPEQRGKRVYHPLTRVCLPRLAPDALLVCHNILFTDSSGDPAFDAVIARNREELGRFAELVAGNFGPFIEYRTTEGVGVARLGGSPANGPSPVAAEIDVDAMS